MALHCRMVKGALQNQDTLWSNPSKGNLFSLKKRGIEQSKNVTKIGNPQNCVSIPNTKVDEGINSVRLFIFIVEINCPLQMYFGQFNHSSGLSSSSNIYLYSFNGGENNDLSIGKHDISQTDALAAEAVRHYFNMAPADNIRIKQLRPQTMKQQGESPVSNLIKALRS